MAGWKLNQITPDLKSDSAKVAFMNTTTHSAISIAGLKYDGSGDLKESQLQRRVLEASKSALIEALELVDADLNALDT